MRLGRWRRPRGFIRAGTVDVSLYKPHHPGRANLLLIAPKRASARPLCSRLGHSRPPGIPLDTTRPLRAHPIRHVVGALLLIHPESASILLSPRPTSGLSADISRINLFLSPHMASRGQLMTCVNVNSPTRYMSSIRGRSTIRRSPSSVLPSYNDPRSKLHPRCRPPAYFLTLAVNGRGGGKSDTGKV